MNERATLSRPLLLFRRAAIVAGVLLGALLLLLGTLFVYLQTEAGKDWLAGRLSSLLSSEPYQRVDLGKIHGTLPWDLRLDHLALGDAQGVWLVLDGLTLRWSPLELLRGHIQVQELSVASIRLDRRPQMLEKESPPESRVPKISFEPPPLTIDWLSLPRISIGEEILGQPALLEVLGFMEPSRAKPGSALALQLKRLDDGPELWALLTARLEAGDSSLKLDMEAYEAPGGLLSKGLSLKDKGALRLRLAGEGPSTSWIGSLDASAAQWGSFAASFALTLEEEVETEWFGIVSPAALVSSAGGLPALASESQIHLKARLSEGELLSLDALDILGAGWSVAALGKLDLKSEAVEAMVTFKTQDLGSLVPPASKPFQGRGELCGVLSGTLKSPRGQVNLDMEDLAAGGFRAEVLGAQLQLNPLVPLSPGGTAGWQVVGAGNGSGLKDSAGRPLPETAVQWSLEAEVPSEGDAALKELRLWGPHHQVEVQGRMDPATLEGSLQADLRVKDLRPFTSFVGRETPGSLTLTAQVNGSGRTRTASGRLKGELVPEGNSADALRGLLGRATTLTTTFEVREGQVLDLSETLLESQAFQVTAKGFVDLAHESMQLELQASMPDMKVLSPLLKKDVSGRVQTELKAVGPLEDFTLTQRIEGRDVRWGQQMPTQIQSTLEAAHLPRMSEGNLKVLVSQTGEKIESSTGFAHRKDHLQLSSLNLVGLGCKLDANLTLDLRAKSAQGSIRGRFEDLARLGRFVGQPLHGSGFLDAQLSSANGSQNLALKVNGKELAAGSGKLAAMDIRADLKDLQRNIQGTLQAELSGLQTGKAVIRSATLKADGDRTRLAFTGRAGGQVMQETDLQFAGFLSRSGEAMRLEMTDFKGKFGPYPIKLGDRLMVQHSPQAVSLERLSLSLGPATLLADGNLTGNRVQGRLSFENLPLQLAALLGGPEMVGTAKGRLEVQGAASQPEGSAEIHLSEFRFRQVEGQKLPAAALHARAHLQGGRLQGGVDLEQILEKPARAEFTVPFRLSLSPQFTVVLPREDPLQAHVEMEGKLGQLAGFLPLPDQNISGNARASMDLSGTLAQPGFSGEFRIAEGFYENLNSGTVLKGLNAEVTARDRRLEITRFQATDGERGKVGLSGWLDLGASDQFSMELEAVLSDATLLRRSELDATANGKVKVSGSPKAMQLTGELSISPAEYRIPARFQAGATELAVIDIHKQGDAPPHEKPSASPSPSLPITIDLTLDFPNRTFVRGRGLDSEWKGKLNISGSARQPVIKGNLDVVRGHFDFLDRRFDLTRGTISFFGAAPPVPMLDFTAEAKAKEITALVKVTGAASAPEIQLQSEPPLPQEEVLARLLFGRSVDRITPLQALKLAQALRSLSGASGLPGLDFLGATRRLLGLDQLELRNTEGKSETGLGLGKYLTEDVYVDVEKDLGGTGGKISVEVELTPNITVESEVGSDAHTGIGVNWKYDY